MIRVALIALVAWLILEGTIRFDVPPLIYAVVFSSVTIALLWLVAKPDKPDKPTIVRGPHPSDVWSGTCYKCGSLAHNPVSLRTGGKPPKYFCRHCRPTFGDSGTDGTNGTNGTDGT